MHPTSEVTFRPELAAGFEEFNLEMDRRQFISQRVCPVLDVAVVANQFSKIPIEQLLRHPETSRAPGANYGRGNWTFTKDSYACVENGWEEPVDDRERSMYRDWVDADMRAVSRAMDAVLRNHEMRVAALIFNTSTWTGASLTTSITNEWDDYENATPIDDVEAAVNKVRANSGLWANAIILSRATFRNLRRCEQIVDLVKYSGLQDPTAKGITAAAIASVFDLEHVIVAGGTKNTADEGQTASLDDIWNPEYAMVCRIDGVPDTKIPTLARTFHYTGDGSQIDGLVEQYREEQTRSDIFRVRHDTHEKVLYPELGHLLTNLKS